MTYEPQPAKPDQKQAPADEKSRKNYVVMFARYSQVAFALPAATFVGWFLGAAMDRWLHTGWIHVVGLVLGSAAGITELIRLANADSKR